MVALVLGFKSSQHLASAYGIAVTGTLAIDSILFFVVVRTRWRKPLWVVLLGAAAFLTVDLAFLSANLTKVLHGGWFPLSIALVVFIVLTTWQKGREIVTANRTREEGPLQHFVHRLHAADPPVVRVPGTAIFLSANRETTPLAMRANVRHNKVLHESVVIVSIETLRVPYATEDARVVIDELGYRDDGITHLTARFGFQEDQNIPEALRRAEDVGLERPIDIASATYFLSRITIDRTSDPGMPAWRKKLFVAIARNSADATEWFVLPRDRTITMGGSIPL